MSKAFIIDPVKDTPEELKKKGTRYDVTVVAVHRFLKKYTVEAIYQNRLAFKAKVDYEPDCGVGSMLSCYVDEIDGDYDYYLEVPRKSKSKSTMIALAIMLLTTVCTVSGCAFKKSKETAATNVLSLSSDIIDNLSIGDEVSFVGYLTLLHSTDGKQGYLASLPYVYMPYDDDVPTLALRGVFDFVVSPVLVKGICKENTITTDYFGFGYSKYIEVSSVEVYREGPYEIMADLLESGALEDVKFTRSALDEVIHAEEMGFVPYIIDVTELKADCEVVSKAAEEGGEIFTPLKDACQAVLNLALKVNATLAEDPEGSLLQYAIESEDCYKNYIQALSVIK